MIASVFLSLFLPSFNGGLALEIAALILLIAACLRLWGTYKRLPPGPLGLPFLGCIPYLQVKSPHFILQNWVKKYGPVMSFYMGQQMIVVLSTRRVLDETLVKQGEAYAGRPPILLPQPKRIRQGHGLITADGELWKEQRRFAARTLRDFCSFTGGSSFEEALQLEVRRLIDSISIASDNEIDTHHLIGKTASGVMCNVLFGRSLDDERSMQAQIDRINYRNASSNVHPMSAILYMPWIVKLPFIRKTVEKFLREGDEITEFFQNLIDDTVARYNPEKEPANYIHAFLKARQDGIGHYFTDDQLLPAVFQLFVGGTETTTTTLRWALFMMAKHSEAQEAVFEEIMKNANATSRKQINKEDMSQLPLTQATIMEVMRLATILPMSAMHRTTKETTVNGYVIPADTCVVPFLYNVHRDEEAFENPLEFNPRRFLMPDGTLGTSLSWIPYSLGKRTCPAASLAKIELFIIFASLIQAFRFALPRSWKPEKDDCVLGFSQSPPQHRLVIEKRISTVIPILSCRQNA